MVVSVRADVDVVVSVSEHPVDELCELPGGREDRDRPALVAGDSAERGAEGRLGALERGVAAILSNGDAIGPKTVASVLQRLAA